MRGLKRVLPLQELLGSCDGGDHHFVDKFFCCGASSTSFLFCTLVLGHKYHNPQLISISTAMAGAFEVALLPAGRHPATLPDLVLKSFCTFTKPQPAKLMVSDKKQYYFMHLCKKHLALHTIQAAVKQFNCDNHPGSLQPCLRCSCSYRICCLPSTNPKTSYIVQITWLTLEWYLGNNVIMEIMKLASPDNPCLVGPDLGYVVESKVLNGTFGAADIYIPQLDLIIQVDGEDHDKPERMRCDIAFNAECARQARRLLRLHYNDVHWFHMYIEQALNRCTNSKGAFTMHSLSHPLFSNCNTG